MFTQTRVLPAGGQALPKVLTFFEAKYYIFSAAFVVSAVFFPWFAHQFNLVGPQFLPMHFFVLIAGFLFGWRTGLFVGFLSPLMGYGITHMPPMIILPQIILELAIYGLTIGMIREKKMNIWFALPVAMIAGRLARILFMLAFASKMNPLQFIQTSWPGILLQIALIPIIVFGIQKFVFSKDGERV